MSMAVKYQMKKRQRMAEGGDAMVDPEKAKQAAESMRKAFHFAEGGEAKGKEARNMYDPYNGKGVHPNGSRDHPGESIAGDKYREGKAHVSKAIHRDRLSELKSMKKPHLYAEGGEVGCGPCKSGMCYAHGGLVDRIMDKRGAKPEADFEDADYDYMDERHAGDEADYTGTNSGDDHGTDDDEMDFVSRIMRKRAS